QKPVLTVPPLNIRESPKLWRRYIRSRSPHQSSEANRGFAKLGIGKDEYRERFQEAVTTPVPDDGWFAWHRMGSHQDVKKGHSFGDYWERFGKDHPEWFALQPNGVRDQSLSAHRPRLCHTNDELIAQAIADRIEELRNDPELPGVAVGLNDGGYTTYCMCKTVASSTPSMAEKSAS
ncbi:MAG: DUF4838 domain-containing protein, partial [Verrucomicrobiota bacterium]